MSEELIQHWNEYFLEKKVNHIFFSAKKEQEKLDSQELEEEVSDESDEFAVKKEEEKEFEPMFDELKKKIDLENELKEMEGETKVTEDKVPEKKKLELNTTEIFSRNQLMEFLESKVQEFGKSYKDRLNVGTVGYPNVGKSSLINVLCGKKRVGVAAMPGKTKHF